MERRLLDGPGAGVDRDGAPLGAAGLEVEILATDLSHSRDRHRPPADSGRSRKSVEIPERHLKIVMLRGVRSNDGTMKCDDAVMAAVRYRRVGLNRPLPDVGMFDAIFCRNVLIYFDPESRRDAIDRILGRLHPGGVLFLGHSESLVNINRRVRTVAPSVYAYGGPVGDERGPANG